MLDFFKRVMLRIKGFGKRVIGAEEYAENFQKVPLPSTERERYVNKGREPSFPSSSSSSEQSRAAELGCGRVLVQVL